MSDWMDFNDDGIIDDYEMMTVDDMFYGDRDDDDKDDDFEFDSMMAGLDVDELEFMDPDERAEVLEKAGLNPDDYDFD